MLQTLVARSVRSTQEKLDETQNPRCPFQCRRPRTRRAAPGPRDGHDQQCKLREELREGPVGPAEDQLQDSRHVDRRRKGFGLPRQICRPTAADGEASGVLRQRIHRLARQVGDRRWGDLRPTRRPANGLASADRCDGRQRREPSHAAKETDRHDRPARNALQRRNAPRSVADVVRFQCLRRQG